MTASAVDEKFLEEVAENVLKEENKRAKNLSVAFVGEAKIRELNKKYRKKDRATDVLSFGGGKQFLSLPKEEKELGEIVICPGVVKRNAKKYNLTFKKELARVLIHGILHLCGYEHEKGKAKAEKMKKREEHYFFQISN